MKKAFKKTIALTLALVMILGVVPFGGMLDFDLFGVSVNAASESDLTSEPINDGTEYEVSNGDESASEEQVIPSTDDDLQEPIEEDLDYFGYVKKHFQHGADGIREYFPFALGLLPGIPIMLLLPFWGTMTFGVMIFAFGYSLAGIGEILFSPIIAVIDVSQK